MPDNLFLRDKVCSFAGLTPGEVEHILSTYSKKYMRYYIPKASGGNRAILHPAPQLKMLQYAISETLLISLGASPIAMAYIRGLKSPLLENAKKHSSSRYTVRIDFKNFFPSIQPNDLLTILRERFSVSDDDAKIVRLALFYSSKRGRSFFLPVGAPTSPCISNVVMFKLDSLMVSTARSIDPDSVVTRYADDVYFSSNLPGCCRKFHDGLVNLLAATPSPALQINDSKTLFLSKATRRMIAGLFVDGNGHVSVGRSRKTAIKKMIYLNMLGRLPDEKRSFARGLLAFVQDCEPEFYNKLAIKYGPSLFSV